MENFLKYEFGNEFADVFIFLNEGNSQQQPPILAHMSILAARCAYFEAYFRSFLPKDRKIMASFHIFNESQISVGLTDCFVLKMTIGDTIPPRQACMSLLRYIYYDDVSMPPQEALYLFSASHYFQFSNLRLHVFCKQNLEANVSKENVFDVISFKTRLCVPLIQKLFNFFKYTKILEAADKIKDEKMKNFALRIVRNNFQEVNRTFFSVIHAEDND